MKVFNFNDDPGIPEGYNYDVWVTDYNIGSYEGSGEAVGINLAAKTADVWSLSHCSCYGPLEGYPDVYSLDYFLNDVTVPVNTELFNKVKELLGQVDIQVDNTSAEQYVFDLLSRKTILKAERINKKEIVIYFTDATQVKFLGEDVVEIETF